MWLWVLGVCLKERRRRRRRRRQEARGKRQKEMG